MTVSYSLLIMASNKIQLNYRISAKFSNDLDPSVLVNGHFDSPLGSPGAGDCGSCVGECSYNDMST